MIEVKLRLRPYASNAEPEWHTVKALVVGDVAIHRPAFLRLEREGGGVSCLKDRWTASHIPTGDEIATAFPPRFYQRSGKCIAKQREVVAWARTFQDTCPEFFAAAAAGDLDAMRQHVAHALETGRNL